MGIYAIIKKDIWVILLCSNNNDSAVIMDLRTLNLEDFG